MGNGWGALLIGLSIIFIVGFIVPLVISPFVEEGVYEHDSFISPIVDFISSVPFSIFPDVQDFIVSQLEAFTYIPDIIAIPLLVLSLILIIYSLIPLV